EAAAHALGESLRESSAVENVVWGLDQNDVSPKMLLTLPTESVRTVLGSLAQTKPLLQSETPAALLQAGMAEAVTQATSNSAGTATRGTTSSPPADFADGADLFVGLMEVFTRRMNTPADEAVDIFTAMNETLGLETWQFMRSANGRLLVVRANLREGVNDKPGYSGSLTELRRHLDAIRQRFEEVPMGLTGLEPTRREAAATIRTAAQRGVGAAIAALWVLTALAWRDVRRPIVVTLATGIAWWLILGWAGVILGTLQPLAGVAVLAAAGPTLYGVLAWCGTSLRRTGAEAASAITPAVLVCAAVGAATGLAVALNPWVETPGMREAGWVGVGAGLVAAVVMLGVLPTLHRLVLGAADTSRDVPPREDLAGALGNLAQRSRRGAWIAAGIVLVVVALGAWRAEVSDNMTGFLPATSEGAQWQRRAAEDGGERGLAAAITADSLADAIPVTEQLRALPEVARVTGIARMVPEDLAAKQQQLAALDDELGDSARRAAAASENETAIVDTPNHDLVLQVTTARFGLSVFASLLPESQRNLIQRMDQAATEFLAAASALDAASRQTQLVALQNDYAACRQQVGELIKELLEDGGLKLDDLGSARSLFSPWISRSHGASPGLEPVTLKVHPVTADGGWPTGKELDRFLAAIRHVAPEATGPLERFAYGTATLRRDLLRVSLTLLVFAALGLGVSAKSWRIGGAVGLILAVSWLTMTATVGWLNQPVGIVA
ncbi:MAG: hypothetical protein AAGL98_03595, partial [Planctomycetota bacterium]